MESIIDILSQGRDREAQASKVHGFVVGLVTNNKDPDKLGRVKVKFPWLSEEVESWWARLAYPMAGKQRGFWWIPEIDDEVLVGFEHGDVRFPYVIGSLYNGVDTPPQCDDQTAGYSGTDYADPGGDYAKGGGDFKIPCGGRDFNEDGANDLRFIRSRTGHIILMDDKGGEECISIVDKSAKHSISISCKDKRIYVNSADGDIHLTADKNIILGAGENIVMHAISNIEMHAEADFDGHIAGNYKLVVDGNMEENVGGSIKREAGTSIDVKSGTSTKLEAGTSMTTSGGTTMLHEASATGTVKSGAPLTIMGAMVNIN